MTRQKKLCIVIYIFSILNEELILKTIAINFKLKIKNEEKILVRKTLQFSENLLPSKDLIEH